MVNDGVRTLCYDPNGSMLNDGIRTYVWDAENRPSSITTSATSSVETYGYDGDGARVTRAVGGGTTTTYLEGVWEASSTGAVKTYYAFGGQMVAVRDSLGVTYLHGDHLGSVSVATSSSGAVVSRQQFDPWGQVRSGGISQTSMNYTGQRRDDTGLLFYNARYYDPAIGRFISADTVVPGAGALTLAPNDDTARDAWIKGGGGPANAQQLNRYSYVNNNPVNKTDPTGHVLDPASGVDDHLGGGGGEGGGGGGGGEGGSRGVSGEGVTESPPLNSGPLPGSTVRVLPNGETVSTINPRTIRFSQNNISPSFKDGRTVSDLTKGLKNGSIEPEEVAPIRLVEKDGKVYTLDNRRLAAFQEAGVDVPFRMATPREIAKETFKFTTTNDGLSITFRGGSR